MTNVSKKTKMDDVQSHISESFDFINKYLPDRYVSLVQEKLIAKGAKVPASGTIRNVRSKALSDPKYRNLTIVKALVDVALESKQKRREDLEELRQTLSGVDDEK